MESNPSVDPKATLTAQLKKSNTEVLVKKLQKSGLFSQEQLEPILNNREELINECLALSHFATSRLRMAAPTEGGSDFQNFLKFFAQETVKRDAENAKRDAENAKRDAETAKRDAATAEQRRIDAAKIEQLNLDREAAEKRYVQERNEERDRRKEERDRHNEQMELLRQQFETARRDDKTQTERAADILRAETAAHRTSLDENLGIQLKRLGDLIKNTLPRFPRTNIDITMCLEHVQTLFDQLEIPVKHRSKLLLPHLSEQARTLVSTMDPTIQSEWDQFLKQLLLAFRITPAEHLRGIANAKRRNNESFRYFGQRLFAMYTGYINSREVKTKEELVELLICDKIKNGMANDLRGYVTNLESQKGWLKLEELSRVADNLLIDNMSFRASEARATPTASNKSIFAKSFDFNKPRGNFYPSEGSHLPRNDYAHSVRPQPTNNAKPTNAVTFRSSRPPARDNAGGGANGRSVSHETSRKTVARVLTEAPQTINAKPEETLHTVAMRVQATIEEEDIDIMDNISKDCVIPIIVNGRHILAKLDTGCQISVARESIIHNQPIKSVGTIELKSAFGSIVAASLLEVNIALDKAGTGAKSRMVIAATDNLVDDFLLSSRDYLKLLALCKGEEFGEFNSVSPHSGEAIERDQVTPTTKPVTLGVPNRTGEIVYDDLDCNKVNKSVLIYNSCFRDVDGNIKESNVTYGRQEHGREVVPTGNLDTIFVDNTCTNNVVIQASVNAVESVVNDRVTDKYLKGVTYSSNSTETNTFRLEQRADMTLADMFINVDKSGSDYIISPSDGLLYHKMIIDKCEDRKSVV